MKSTDRFKNTIKAYLDERAELDPLFAEVYSKENKNIDDCVKFILNTVQSSGINGFTDEEVFSMAIHYYDVDDIKPGKDLQIECIVNHQVVLTPEEKAAARKKAIDSIIQEEKQKILNRNKKPTPIKGSQAEKEQKEKKEKQPDTLF